jgi:hypothetical protein
MSSITLQAWEWRMILKTVLAAVGVHHLMWKVSFRPNILYDRYNENMLLVARA